ncbi:hypothetical protein EOD39_14294 [Acipenser ruthenus]|uniref:Uncharacterized protein n=1 Tax=Acipenser ruthenus TaxID=7906 RepID=A0A662YM06_ACIRT|nr:hypothetical protein EOD39_14294 [Acipenser ruthenus]
MLEVGAELGMLESEGSGAGVRAGDAGGRSGAGAGDAGGRSGAGAGDAGGMARCYIK